jgi:NitT/TauT family transport system permease protein
MSIHSPQSLTVTLTDNLPNTVQVFTWLKSLQYPVLGIIGFIAIWWFGGYLIENNPDLGAFAAFAPAPTFSALVDLVRSGEVWEPIGSSLYRILAGLVWGIGIGVPVGITVGYFGVVLKVTNVPFQFLRMISPLAWMPIAVLAFDSWNSAIIFLIAMATVWPIIFSTAHGVRRIDPNWFKVARNLGASGVQMLRRIILPAIMMDVMVGIRLAVGVAWVVLVPAEYLGVTSGLGYAINDARDTLSYDTLAAMVIVIGIIGYCLDTICSVLIQRFNWHVA